MRHRKAGRKLNRNSSHRKAMFSNMVAALITHGRIETTLAKAKELRRIAERTIRWSTSVSDLLAKDQAKLSMEERVKIVHAIRMAKRVLKDRAALDKLFRELAQECAKRPGGYTRILKSRTRRGDAAPMAYIEVLDAA